MSGSASGREKSACQAADVHDAPPPKFAEEDLESIDRDNSGSIDREELVFALQHLGLDHKLAGAIFAEGDTDGDGVITLDEFYSLVATVSARERQREALQEQQLARQRHLEKQQERQQLAHHRKGECDYKAKEEARQAQSIGGGIARAATKKATKSLLPLELDVLARCTQQAEAVAASINELVSKASSFPIGLLANAQQLNTLVAGFNPEGYAERARGGGAVRAAPPRLRCALPARQFWPRLASRIMMPGCLRSSAALVQARAGVRPGGVGTSKPAEYRSQALASARDDLQGPWSRGQASRGVRTVRLAGRVRRPRGRRQPLRTSRYASPSGSYALHRGRRVTAHLADRGSSGCA